MTLTNVLFPPYMGGCIRISIAIQDNAYVSSLYGRVYRWLRGLFPHFVGFLPVREGVSGYCLHNPQKCLFPPYMGGCIAAGTVLPLHFPVSSLYGRVYRR